MIHTYGQAAISLYGCSLGFNNHIALPYFPPFLGANVRTDHHAINLTSF